MKKTTCIITLLAIACGLQPAMAEIYTLSNEAIYSALPQDENDRNLITEFSTTLEENGVTWTLRFDAKDKITVAGIYPDKTGDKDQPKNFTVTRNHGGTNEDMIAKCTLTTDYFKNALISGIDIQAAIYGPGNTGKQETITAAIGGSSYDKTISMVSIGYRIEKISFDTENNSGTLIIIFDAPSGGNFAFRAIDITYEDQKVEPITVTRTETIPVGHALKLTASNNDASIFYSIDGTENWQSYVPERGIVFDQPGEFTLKYYASSTEANSRIISEVINVEKLNGLDAAKMANGEIEVAGWVVAQRGTYTLIGDNPESPESDCLALDNSQYTGLKDTAKGDKISATGRATDRFGEDVPALGSLSSVSINGKASSTTNIAEARKLIAPNASEYDLHGRRATTNTKLRIIPGQGKTIIK